MGILNRIKIRRMSPRKYVQYLRNKGVAIGEGCEIYKDAHFGSEPYLIRVGNHVRINSGVHLITHDGGCWVLRDEKSGYASQFKDADCFGQIDIGDNVHIGTNAIIMPGVTIGSNSIIACGAVVTHDVPAFCIVGGIPAHMIENLDEYALKMKSKCLYTKNLSGTEKEKVIKEKYYF